MPVRGGGSAMSANQGGKGVGSGDQTRKKGQNYSKIEKFVIRTPKPGIQVSRILIQRVLTEPKGCHQISIPAHYR